MTIRRPPAEEGVEMEHSEMALSTLVDLSKIGSSNLPLQDRYSILLGEFEALLDSVDGAVILVDKTGVVKLVNVKWKDVWGIDPSCLLGKSFHQIQSEVLGPLVKDAEEFKSQSIWTDGKPNKESSTEVELVHPSPKVLRGFTTAVWNQRSELIGHLVMYTDITPLRKIEQQMIQGERMRVMGQLASGIAHDFNNSLAAIMGFSQLLLSRKRLSPDIKRGLEVIQSASQGAAQVVRRLQAFSRPYNINDLEEVDVNQVCRDALEATRFHWQNEAGKMGIEKTTSLELSSVPHIIGIAAELREALVNIIINASDAMPQGGDIILRTWREEDEVCISVGDTGIGMTEEVKEHIFEPFFTTKETHQGTGLGLSIARQAVEHHQGSLKVNSQVGNGSTFTIRIPIAKGARVLKKPPVRGLPERRLKPSRILVIEDQPNVQEVLKAMLEYLGQEVKLVPNGLEGLNTMAQDQFDLVLLDLAMPQRNGWQVLDEAKERLVSTPIVLVTGWGHEVSLDYARSHGASGVLPKPLSMRALTDILQATLGSREV